MTSAAGGAFVFDARAGSDSDENRAAVYRAASDTWRETARPPFTSLLSNQLLARSGNRVVVAGWRCDQAGEAESDLPDCAPGGVEVAVYDTGDDEWESLPDPPPSEPDGPPSFVGFLSGSVVVGMSHDTLVAFDADEGAWWELPRVPLDSGRPCVLDGRLVVTEALLDPFGAGDPPPDRFDPLVAAVFDRTSQRWSALLPSGREYPHLTNFSFVCGAEEVIAIPHAGRTVAGEPVLVHRFAPASGWSSAPPPSQEEPFGSVLSADVSGDATLVRTTLGQIRILPDQPWELRPDPDLGRSRASAALDQRTLMVLQTWPAPRPSGFARVTF